MTRDLSVEGPATGRGGLRRLAVIASTVVVVTALALVQVSGMRIGLGAHEPAYSLWALGLVGVLGGLGVQGMTRSRAAALCTPIAGVLLAAEGVAVGWLGHQHGDVQTPIGLALCAVDAAMTARRHGSRPAMRRAISEAATIALLAAAIGVAGQYLTFLTNPGGFDCLAGFSGDPSQYPDAPAEDSGITTSFSWLPLGRACTYDTSGGTVTRIQTSPVTSAWIWGTAAVGGLLVAGRLSLLAMRRGTRA